MGRDINEITRTNKIFIVAFFSHCLAPAIVCSHAIEIHSVFFSPCNMYLQIQDSNRPSEYL